MTATCPACGNPLPADAPAGLCPRCLLAGGFATAASPPTADFEPPTVAELAPLFPHLEIIELLGAGGMGAVYKARQPHLDRLVALKVLPPRDDPAFAERFTREARTLAKLNHPSIVHIYDFGQAGGHSYIVMEFVEGVNLRQAERAGKMTPAEALAVVPQICAALQFAHENGIVHRDIKPENVLLDAKGRVKIADFGLAKLLGGHEPRHLTGTHQAMGTLHYMAPEQWEKPASVDHRADIYSLGVVFYELLTGELPLGRFAPPSEKVQVDVRLDQVVLRALEKEPERRYQRASDVQTDVEGIAAKPPPPVLSVAPPLPQQNWTASRVIAWLAIVTSIIIWPFGLIAIPVARLVSYKQKRSMVRVFEDAVLILGLHRIATWMSIVCLLGVANASWPWVTVGSNSTRWETVFAFDTWFSIFPSAIAGGFLLLGLFFFATARLPRLWLWRAGAALAGGGVLIVLGLVFLQETRALRGPKTDMANPFGRGNVFSIDFHPGPFVAEVLAAGLMVLGAIDLRGYLSHRPDGTATSADPSATAFSDRPPPVLPRSVALPPGTVDKPNVLLWLVLPAVPIIGLAVAAFLGRSHDLDSLAAAVALVGSPLVILANVLAWAAYRRQRSDLLLAPAVWCVTICLTGVADVFLPWARISGLPGLLSGLVFYPSGFELGKLHLGKVIAGIFLVLAGGIVVAARRPAWRPRVTIAGAVLVLIVWGIFFATTDPHPRAVGQETIGERTTEINQSVNEPLLPAAFVPPLLALLLLACAALDLGTNAARRDSRQETGTSDW